jgi:DNA-binding XRE family transcriptional regulator
MKENKSVSYLRSYRLRWGLSQGELAYLLGWSRSDVISRIEKKRRLPTLRLLIGCFILFGTAAAEIFPDMFAGIERDIMARVWALYEKVQGDPSRKTRKKIELLEDAIERAKARNLKPDP